MLKNKIFKIGFILSGIILSGHALAKDIKPSSIEEYEALLRAGYTCTATSEKSFTDWGGPRWDGNDQICYFQSEGHASESMRDKVKLMPNSRVGINDYRLTQIQGPRDYTTRGVSRCQMYTPAGCPSAWCSHTVKFGYVYKEIICRPPTK